MLWTDSLAPAARPVSEAERLAIFAREHFPYRMRVGAGEVVVLADDVEEDRDAVLWVRIPEEHVALPGGRDRLWTVRAVWIEATTGVDTWIMPRPSLPAR